jgi:hypothetical protein
MAFFLAFERARPDSPHATFLRRLPVRMPSPPLLDEDVVQRLSASDKTVGSAPPCLWVFDVEGLLSPLASALTSEPDRRRGARAVAATTSGVR